MQYLYEYIHARLVRELVSNVIIRFRHTSMHSFLPSPSSSLFFLPSTSLCQPVSITPNMQGHIDGEADEKWDARAFVTQIYEQEVKPESTYVG